MGYLLAAYCALGLFGALNMIRQPIICVMGHVDHGKTTLLDKIRSTAMVAKEAGGITQHIGASEVPIEVIKKICSEMQNFSAESIKIPGLLFIDTPGHEAFTNLRRRGGSVADLAILVIDITKGFEPQTVEAIRILREYKTPFIVAANKIDMITGWINSKSKSLQTAMKQQNSQVIEALNKKVYEVVGKLGEMGFSSDLYSNVTDFRQEISIVPVSAKTGEGVAELLMLATGLSQRFLEMKLNIEVNGKGRGSILEKKEDRGLGFVIDVILYDGTLHVNDTIAFATSEGKVETTKIKALLKPKPLSEIRDSSNKFDYLDKVSAASGVRIGANNLDYAMPGSPVIQVVDDSYAKEISSEIGSVFATSKVGVILKADSIGSIEAISKLLDEQGVSISKKGIGNVSKRDVMDAFAMNAINPMDSIILAFNVGIDKDAEDAVFASNIKIIRSEIIYKLVDDCVAAREGMRLNRAKAIEEKITLPFQIEVLPHACFRASHPAIFGVRVVAGRVKQGAHAMSDEGVPVGKIRGIQNEKTPMTMAKANDEVAISMDEPTFGRQVKEGQMLYSKLSLEDIKMLQGEMSYLISDEEKDLVKRIAGIGSRNKK